LLGKFQQNELAARLDSVRQRMAQACEKSGRDPASVTLLAVSKLQPVSAIAALNDLGLQEFGENRLQEALAKQAELTGRTMTWHFIGPVQSNKTRDIASHFDWVQSVDRPKIVQRLHDQRPKTMKPLNVCLQVNIDEEPQKAGVPVASLPELAARVADCDRLRLRGLMCIPELSDDTAKTLSSFRRVARLAEKLRGEGHEMDTLSMGMSGDLELAIEAGSTLIRVGTDLFGPRSWD
jgi:pyridoxal phosphate enzyme (YggS family)